MNHAMRRPEQQEGDRPPKPPDGRADVTPISPRLAPLREFIATENASAIVLLVASVVAVVWANSPWSASYESVWTTELSLRLGGAELTLDLRHWINDGLMAMFFFVVGLEIRREFDLGELRERRRVATPVLAAIGGMVVPALIYLSLNATEPSAGGWGIAMPTDTAFALGVLALIGGASARARTFLLTVVIVDDVVALTVIALVYTQSLSLPALLVAVGLFAVVLLMRRAGIAHGVAYFIVAFGVWVATLKSGVHATIAGVVIGVLASAYPPRREALQRAGAIWRLFREEPTPDYARLASRTLASAVSPNERLQRLFHPWTSYVIVPLFALANAGVELSTDALLRAVSSPITLGIVAGLVVGKIVGIVGVAWLASLPRFGGLPLTVPWANLVTVATVAGIGFTVSLLIAEITFEGDDLEEAKLGIFAASVLAALLAWAVVRVIGRLPPAVRFAGEGHLAPPIADLAEEVDPFVDHIRGPLDAPVTLVEYGDFECPYCGRAEPVIRDLSRSFGNDLAFVFRHLPLDDVHEHARLAAEAAEAAAAQGFFWEMHDVLMATDELSAKDIARYAEEIGLDVDRFMSDLQERRHAPRVDRDISSADESGAAGTPTFFINGRRYQGRHDAASMADAVKKAYQQASTTRADSSLG
ncbi:MAG: Na+/H+ antiporter NhaA [Actinomycetota bacterium]|nr:Na+/H+ antiporter NhaA [Actinomycetota bacterium]